MKLNNNQLCTIIEGSTILGTGGGGRLDSAMSIIEKLSSVELISVDELKPDDVVITAYGAGGLTKPKNTNEIVSKGLKLLEKRLGKKVKAIVPVEIGPYSLALAFEMASKLNVPIVNGDLVGYRSVPEIYIELVTLANLPRCPLVFGNNEGDLILLEAASNAERLEQIIRTFADQSESNTFVLGYPYSKVQLAKCIAQDSVSYCLKVKELINKDFKLFSKGTITQDFKQEVDGFTSGYLIVETSNSNLRIDFKNEYLALLKDEVVVITCPDFICVVDDKTGLGLNNGDDNQGKNVRIYVKPAISQWYTPNGLRLFSPKKLGLTYKQKVLGNENGN